MSSQIISPTHHRSSSDTVTNYYHSIKPKADELKASDLASAIETIKKLEEKLADFAKTHKSAIQHDPEFRAKFLEMCVPLGVDPLSTSKSFWGAMLGLGEFYCELSVKVAEVCIASRSRNGGIIRYDASIRQEERLSSATLRILAIDI
jgi:ESCRT-II complex subunit VPS22